MLFLAKEYGAFSLPPTTLVFPRLISFSSPANQKREERREPVTTTVCAQVLKSSSGLRSTRSIDIVVRDKRKFASVVEGALVDDEEAAVGGLFGIFFLNAGLFEKLRLRRFFLTLALAFVDSTATVWWS